MKSNEIVEQWVSKRSSFYFFLPDGPYGRPFDNQYLVERIEETSDGFKIFLSDNLMLHFIGDTEIEDEGCNLLINNFNCCVFSVSGHDIKKYDRGEVVLSGF
ncbi:hypothetical protein MNO11_02550 [Serratia plymuthica]|uniref:hypothetical protein n=1 Tax=Serratia plymuthica TaxID=82996 RepID=UPI001F53C73F|nr:hypothetical protein [Serratia plymuthica]UNK28661.1 hypothetical protein MNO11_02550 [Serratia plymuthica]